MYEVTVFVLLYSLVGPTISTSEAYAKWPGSSHFLPTRWSGPHIFPRDKKPLCGNIWLLRVLAFVAAWHEIPILLLWRPEHPHWMS